MKMQYTDGLWLSTEQALLIFGYHLASAARVFDLIDFENIGFDVQLTSRLTEMGMSTEEIEPMLKLVDNFRELYNEQV